MTNDSTNCESTPKEIEEVRKLVDLGLRSISNTTLEELEKISGPLKKEEILILAALGTSKMGLLKRKDQEKNH